MRIAVIGGGPAGVMAALAAAVQGADVTLFERNDRLLRKLRISGKGRCNLTNAMQPDMFMNNILRGARFMRSSFSAFDNNALMAYTEEAGVKLKVERGQRVFPVSDDANEVAAAYERLLKEHGVRVEYNSRVKGIDVVDISGGADAQGGAQKAVAGITLQGGGAVAFDGCVLATGGLSYPRTGSTGDGYRMAASLGHDVTELLPSLAPVTAAEGWIGDVQGLSLRNVELHVYVGKKKIFSERGEMLFTDSGVSGPLVLSASAHMAHDRLAESRLVIDLKPALTDSQLDARLLRDLAENSNRLLRNSLGGLLPKSLIPAIIAVSGADADKACNSVTKQERQALLESMKRLTLRPTGIGPVDAAIVTRGGIDLRRIDPKTMRSKLVRGLYFAGEVMDIDGYTGGFNLQLAFTTGYTAGKNCVIID